jgi:parallel beta-helix repeat protein
MPRSTDPGSLTSGSGLAAADSVDLNALINPVDDTVRVHIVDPSRAHQARAIHVVDSAGLFVSDHVEGCLTELAGGTSAFSSNGLISGGTYTVAAGVLTLDAGTTALVNGNAIDFSGFTIALPATVTDNWLSINKNTALLQITAAAPALADEHIPLWRITTDGTPAITAFTDARYFIFNVDRKMPYTVRNNGADDNRHSDANFESMSAAFLWLATYWPTNESERAILIVRGQETLTSTLVVPIPNLVIEGEGGGQLNAGAVLSPMIDLNGKNKVTIKNLALMCAAGGATSTAIGNTGAALSSPQVLNCDILSNGGDWDYGVRFAGASVERAVLQHCNIQAAVEGYHNDLPKDDRVLDCRVNNPLGVPASSVGVSIGDPGVAFVPSQGKAIVKDCTVEGFSTGIFLKGALCTARDNRLLNPDYGFSVEGLSCMVRDNYVIMSHATAWNGLEIRSGNGHKVTGNVLTNSRTTGHAGTPPYGILITGGDNAFLDGNHIDGFFSDSGASYGIYASAGVNTTTINGGYIKAPSTGVHLAAGSDVAQVTGVRLLDSVTGLSLGGTSAVVQGCVVNLNATTGETGCVVSGNGCKLLGTRIQSTRVWGAPTGITPRGIQLTGSASDFTATTCTLAGFDNTADVLGAAVEVGAGFNRVSILNTLVEGCHRGVQAAEVAHDHLTVSGCTFQSTNSPISLVDTTGLQTHSVKILDNTIEGSGSSPIVVTGYRDFAITGNTIAGAGLVDTAILVTGVDSANQRVRGFSISGNTIQSTNLSGIRVLGYAQNGTVSDNQINNQILASTQVTAVGIVAEQNGGAFPQYLTISGNTIWNSTDGILLQGAAGSMISRCTVDGNILHHIADDVAPADTFVGAGGKAIGLEQVSDTIISNNQIRNLGLMINTADTLYAPAGPNYSAQGIYCLNCQGLSITGNNLRQADPGGTGVAYGIAARQRGLSVAATSQVFNITDNTVWDATSTMDALILVNPSDTLTAGAQTLEGVTIDGNTLRGGTNAVFVDMGLNSVLNTLVISNNTCDVPSVNGINVSALGDTVSITGISITGNSVTSPLVEGIGITGAATVAGTITDAIISGNTINQSFGGGISVAALNTAVGSQVDYTNVTVAGNAVTGPTGSGIVVNVGGGGTGSTLTNAVVSDNTVYNAGAIGIDVVALYLGSGAGLASVSNCNVSGNTVELTGTGSGIRVGSGSATSTVGELRVSENTIRQAGANGIFLPVLSGGSITGAIVSGNAISSAGLAGISALNTANGTYADIQINDNIIRGAVTNGVEVGVNTGFLAKMQVNDNLIASPGTGGAGASQGIGVTFLAGNGPMEDVQINNNTIKNAGTMGIALGGVELVVQATATITVAAVLAGNSVTIGGTTLTAVTGAPGPFQFERVTNNTTTAQNLVAAINDVANGLTGTVSASNTGNIVTVTAVALGSAGNGIVLSENTAGTTIVVTSPTAGGAGGATDASTMSRFQVCHNTIQTPEEGGILVLTYDGTIRSFTISDNVINRPGQGGGGISNSRGGGILLGAAQVASTVVFDRITMSGNRLTWNLGDTGANFAYGIGLLGNNCDITDVSISDCKVLNSPASGIYVGTLATSGGLLDSITFKDCDAHCQASAANAATYPHYGAAMVMAASAPGGPHNALSIQGCTLRSDSTRALAAAAAILAFPWGGSNGGKFRSVNVSDNLLTNSYNGFFWTTLVGAGGAYTGLAPVMDNIIISHNVVRVCEGFAIGSPMLAESLPGSSDQRIENVQITDNSCSQCATAAGLNLVIAVEWPLPCINVVVSRNQVFESGNVTTPAASAITAAVSLTLGALGGSSVGLQNLSVCDNEVYDIIGSGMAVGTSLAADAAAQTTSVRNIKVNGNAVRTVSEGGIAVLLPRNSNALQNIEVNDNSVSAVSGNAGTGLGNGLWVAMVSFTMVNLSVCRNQVRTANDAGINVDLSGLDGVIQANISDNSVRTTTVGQGILFTGPSIGQSESVRISDNQVYDSAAQGIRAHANDYIINLDVTGNQVEASVGNGIDLDVEDSDNVNVTDNSIGAAQGKGLLFFVTSAFLTPKTVRNVSVSRNSIRASTGNALEWNCGVDAVAQNLSVSENQVHGTNVAAAAVDSHGVFVDLTNAEDFRDVHVDGNSVYGTVGAAGVDQGVGIRVLTPDVSATTVRGLSVCDNHVSTCNEGITVLFQDQARMVDISRNVIENCTVGDASLDIVTQDGAPLDLLYQVSVQSNAITGGGPSKGIRCKLERNVQDFLFHGNQVRGATTGLEFALGAGTGRAVVFSHNSIRGSSTIPDVIISGTNIPNAGVSAPGAGWICSQNVSSKAAATGGWGVTGTLGSFCYHWDFTTGNQDGVV